MKSRVQQVEELGHQNSVSRSPSRSPKGPALSGTAVAERANRVRRLIIGTVAGVGEGYLLQGLGAADILAVLYFSELRQTPANPDDPDRDRCLLCTAHNSVALYSTLAERGFFPAKDLDGYGQDGNRFEIISSEIVPGVEGTFGSLGQGLSVGVGLALSSRRNQKDWRVYAVLGDGEMQEGQTWEAVMASAAYGLDNLCVVVDLNGMQVEGSINDVLPMGDIPAKWRSFGWSVQEIDGNDVDQLMLAFDNARDTVGLPSVIVARTTPGYPISFLQGKMEHYAKLTRDQASTALAELADSIHGGRGDRL